MGRITQFEKEHLEADNKAVLAISFCQEGGRRLDINGMFAVATRSVLTMAAMADLGLLLLEDYLDRFKVARCKLLQERDCMQIRGSSIPRSSMR